MLLLLFLLLLFFFFVHKMYLNKMHEKCTIVLVGEKSLIGVCVCAFCLFRFVAGYPLNIIIIHMKCGVDAQWVR